MKQFSFFLVLCGCLAAGILAPPWVSSARAAENAPEKGESSPPVSTRTAIRKILPNDALSIRVVGEPEWAVVGKRVGEDGTITFPYIGRLEVRGLTPSEVEKLVREKLLDGYFKNPEVVVIIDAYTVQTVSVLGKVIRPGPVELPPDRRLDLIEAIARAGDLHPLAKKSRIELRRGSEKVRHFSYDELKAATEISKKIYVEPNDIIFVPDRLF